MDPEQLPRNPLEPPTLSILRGDLPDDGFSRPETVLDQNDSMNPELDEDLLYGDPTDAGWGARQRLAGMWLSNLRKRTSQWPFPFSDRRFENEYWGFTEPLPFIAPIWMLLQMFNTYGPFSDTPPDVRTHPIGLAVHNLRIVVMSLGFFTAGVQLLLWVASFWYTVQREKDSEDNSELLSASTSIPSAVVVDSHESLLKRYDSLAPSSTGVARESGSATANSARMQVPAPPEQQTAAADLPGKSATIVQSKETTVSLPIFSPGTSTHADSHYAETGDVASRRENDLKFADTSKSSSSSYGPGVDRLMTRLPTVLHYTRVIQLYVMVLNCLASSLESWNCMELSSVASWKMKYKGRIPTLLPFFPSAYILRASLTWEIPRLLAFPIIETVLPFTDITTQPPEGVFTHIFVAWVLAALFIFMLWEAERESRLRFLTYKALHRLRILLQRRKQRIHDTLESLCEKESLTNLLSGQIVRDESANCAILVTTIHDFQIWRLNATVFQAVKCVDRLYEEMEILRMQRFREIEFVSLSGDTYTASYGLSLAGKVRRRIDAELGRGLMEQRSTSGELQQSTLSGGRSAGFAGAGSESNAFHTDVANLSVPAEQPINQPLSDLQQPAPLAPSLSLSSSHPSVLGTSEQRPLQGLAQEAMRHETQYDLSEDFDPSEIVLYAFQLLSLPRWVLERERLRRVPGIATLTLLSQLTLRVGLGFGACDAGILPIRGLPTVLQGEALDEANAAVTRARPATLELPKEVLQICRQISITHLRTPRGQSQRSDSATSPSLLHSNILERVRVTNVRRKRRPTPLQRATSLGSMAFSPSQNSDVTESTTGTLAWHRTVDKDTPTKVASSGSVVDSRSESAVHATELQIHPPKESEPSTHILDKRSSISQNITGTPSQTPKRHRNLEISPPENRSTEPQPSRPVPQPSAADVETMDSLRHLSSMESKRESSDFDLRSEAAEEEATIRPPPSRTNQAEQYARRDGSNQSMSLLDIATQPADVFLPLKANPSGQNDYSSPGPEPSRRHVATWRLKTALTDFLLLFHPILEQDFCAWVDMRLAQRKPFIIAVWTVLWIGYAIPYFHEAAFTPTADIYIGLSAGVIMLFELMSLISVRVGNAQRKSTPFLASMCRVVFPLRYLVFLLGASSMLLVQGACISSKKFTFGPTRFPILIWIFAFCMTSIDGLPLLLTLAMAVGSAVFGVQLGSFASRAIPGSIITYILPMVLVLVKTMAVRKEFKQLKNLADLHRRAATDRRTHEALLNLILPSYIVTLIANVEGRDSKQAVSDAIWDAAMLLVKFPSFISGGIEQKFVLLSRISEFVQRQKDISLLHTDGDVAMICGPLARPDDADSPQKVLSSAQRTFRRRIQENVATVASLSALLTLKFILRLLAPFDARPTAVLSRADGVAVVFQHRRPVFQIEGRIAELSRAILQELAPGSLCTTREFLSLCPTAVAQFPTAYGLQPVPFPARPHLRQQHVDNSRDSLPMRIREQEPLPLQRTANTSSETSLESINALTSYVVKLRLRGIGYVDVIFLTSVGSETMSDD
jgi:hypothetical protein